MNSPIDNEIRRVRTLIIAMRGLLECAVMVENNTDQLAGAVFMLTEIADAVERLAQVIVKPAND